MALTAFITGATAGIGEKTAEKMAEQGINLIISGRRQERLQALADSLNKKHSVEVLPLCFDLSKPEEIKTIVSENFEALKSVSILINNAGLARGVEPVDQAQLQDWEMMIDTNIKGLFYLTRHLLPVLQKHPNSHIVNLASVAGRWVYPGGAVYCATKHAARAFSEGLRMDLLGKNVRVTQISPGMVETEFSEVRLGDAGKAKKVYEGMTPLVADDIAEAIVWSVQRPQHVTIQEMVIYPTDQASVQNVFRQGV